MHIEQLVRAYARLCERNEDITHVHTHTTILDYYNDIIEHYADALPGEKDRLVVMAKAMGQRMWKLSHPLRQYKYYQVAPDWCMPRTGRSSFHELDELRQLQIALAGRYSKLRGKVEHQPEWEVMHNAYCNRMMVLQDRYLMEDDRAEFLLLSSLLDDGRELVRVDLQEQKTVVLHPVTKVVDDTPVLFLPKKEKKTYSHYSTKGSVGPKKYRTPSQTSARGQKNTAISPDRLIAEQHEYISG